MKREDVLAACSSEAASLINEVEKTIGSPINFSLLQNDPTGSNAAAIISNRGATIKLASKEAITKQGLVHELLHVKICAEGVPGIIAATGRNPELWFASHLGNAVMHEMIVPMEPLYGSDPKSNWVRYYDLYWSGNKDNVTKRPDHEKLFTACIDYLSILHTQDLQIIQHVDTKLKRLGLYERVIEYNTHVKNRINDIPDVFSYSLNFFDIPTANYRLQWIDFRAQDYITKTVPMFPRKM